ncbi:MAG: RNA polymerase sigma factor [Planctomycetota bacterium]|nr:MAG: RNA polymerase sigma factor [Planctomycetota bacterium]
MENDVNYLELVKKARLGDQESMNKLAELAEGRLFAYIYRLTLNYHLTDDLLQETLLSMVKSLKELRQPERFWVWLFRTALGKVQHHFREQQQERIIKISALERARLLERIPQDCNDGLNNLIRRDLSDSVFGTMKELTLRHRSVLALRCFEQMPYSEIAMLMKCSELQARVLFFRAKYSLRRHLARKGLGKGMLLTALGLLGLMTASAKAASATTSVSAASLEVGFTATVIGAATTKAGAIVIAAITTAILSLTAKNPICLVALFLYVLFWFLLLVPAGIYRK